MAFSETEKTVACSFAVIALAAAMIAGIDKLYKTSSDFIKEVKKIVCVDKKDSKNKAEFAKQEQPKKEAREDKSQEQAKKDDNNETQSSLSEKEKMVM